MTTERWHRIEDLFHQARERPPAERRPFIEAAAAGDTELRDEVLSLDASLEGAGEFLDVPPVPPGCGNGPAAAQSLDGRRIGPTGWSARSAAGAWAPSIWLCATTINTASVSPSS